MNKEIEPIGQLTFDANGIPYFCLGETENGYCYKDAEIYENNWDETCYIPENATPDLPSMKERGLVFESYDGDDCYSHRDLLNHCFGNHALCDYMFEELSWEFPSTFLSSLEQYSRGWRYFYDYVKEGARLWWNDPARETCGWVVVENVPTEEELPEEDWNTDTIILVRYGRAVAEVPLCELTTYPYITNIEDNE